MMIIILIIIIIKIIHLQNSDIFVLWKKKKNENENNQIWFENISVLAAKKTKIIIFILTYFDFEIKIN